MKVLHVASSYPLHAGDSTAPFMEEIAAAQVEAGHAVRIIVPHRHDLVIGMRSGVEVVGYKYAPRQLQSFGYGQSLSAAGKVRRSTVAITPLAMASMLVKVRSSVGKWQPDVLHLHWLLPQGVAARFQRKAIPIVASIHGADAKLAQSSAAMERLAGSVLRRADHVVAASKEMIDLAARIEPGVADRSSVILHGASSQLFRPSSRSAARDRLGVDPASSVLLGVGRLVAKKGFEYLIRAMGELEEGTALFVVGDGPLRGEIERLANSVGPDRVTMVGAVSREELVDWYAAADLMVIPSVHDGTDVDSGPVVLMEALAMGRAVIATPVGMAGDVIRPGVNGDLVAERDAAALAAAIRVALPRAAELGEAARATFDAVGDWSRVAADLTAVYTLAIDRRKRLLAG